MSDYMTTWLRKASSAILLTCEPSVADDISLKLDEAADEIDRLTEEVARLRAGWLDQAARDSTEIVRLETEVARLREALADTCPACGWTRRAALPRETT